MQRLKTSIWLGPLLSGLMAFVAVGQINFYCSWIFYIPLFISIHSVTPRIVFIKAFLFGAVLASTGFFWMIPGAERFTGYNVFYGIVVFAISVLFFALYNAVVFYLFALAKSNRQRFSLLINCLLIAAFLTVGESLLMYVSQGFPWFDLHSGSGLAANLYSIQPAAIFGVHILSFVVVVVNYLAAVLIERKSYAKLYIPAAVFICYMLVGLMLVFSFNSKTKKENSFNVVILAENIMPDIKWDDNNGNMLVQQLLQLNRAATALKPGIILWSESAIPWTYSKDDDLVNEVLKASGPAGITQILGINTAIKENEVYNSAYCILPGGNVAGRYDKQYLLALIEKPLNGLIMPFFSSKGFIAKNDASHSSPLKTNYGSAGILICNEAAVPAAAAAMVNQGAQYLFNMSNDGWFNDTYIVRLHYYYDRLRAVESRKDLAVNCNNGYSGLIKASGEIEEMKRSDEPFVQMVTMAPNNYTTLASRIPKIFVYLCALFILFIFITNRINGNKDGKHNNRSIN